MDRTEELLKYSACALLSLRGDGNVHLPPPQSASPLVLKANELFQQLSSFENLVNNCYEGYVDFHKYYPLADGVQNMRFSAQERSHFDSEIIFFVSSIASEIQDLNRCLEHMINGSISESSLRIQFHKQMISDLLSKLGAFTSRTEKMQKEYQAHNISPFRLFADHYSTSDSDSFGEAAESVAVLDAAIAQQQQQQQAIVTATNRTAGIISLIYNSDATTATSATSATTAAAAVPASSDDFAQRYVDEIAPAAKLKEYDLVASQQKASLLQEAKLLCEQFSSDMKESYEMEKAVSSISSMLNEFVQLVESQSGVVDVLGEVAADATESVLQTDQELLLTLERTESHQWSMIAFNVGLALLLLLLDLLSP